MPLRQFLWRHDGHGMHLTRCDDGTFDVVNLSSIRFPYIVIFEDLRIITQNATGQCTVNLDVSDLDGNDIKIKNSNDCVFVEGKREFHDGKSWVQYQVCRRLPLPNNYQVKSVHSKHVSYGKIALTIKMEGIWEAVPDLSPSTKTVLMCDGVIQQAGTRTGPLKVKLHKIQPKVVSFARKEQGGRRLFGQVNTNLQVMDQTGDSEESDSDEYTDEYSDEPVEQNERPYFETKYVDSQVQVGQSYCNENPDLNILGQKKTQIYKEIACGPELSANSYIKVVFSRQMAEPAQSGESESEEEQPDVELLNADRKTLGQKKTQIYKEIACRPDREQSASSYRKVVISMQMAEPVQSEESESEEEQPDVELLNADRKILGQKKTQIYKEIACGPDREQSGSSNRKVVFSKQMAEPVQSEEEEPDVELLNVDRNNPSVDPKTEWAELTTMSQNEVKINLDWEQERANRPRILVQLDRPMYLNSVY